MNSIARGFASTAPLRQISHQRSPPVIRAGTFLFPAHPRIPPHGTLSIANRPPRQGTPDLCCVSFTRGFAAFVSSSLGSPPLTQRPQVGAATGMPWGRNAARSNFIRLHKFKDMDNQPSFAERTKQLKEIAFQLKNAADVVLAEVQHMEAAQERFAQKAKDKADKKGRA